MDQMAIAGAYDLLTVIFVDLVASSTTLHFAGNLAEEVATDLGGMAHGEDSKYGYIMSRKKDVIPLITNIIEKKKT